MLRGGASSAVLLMLLIVACFFAPVACGSAPADTRALFTGALMQRAAYNDQPYCTHVSARARWLCVLTTNAGAREGGAGEHMVSLFSDDSGLTWSAPMPIEPDPLALTNAYGTIVQTGFGRVWAIYNFNAANVTTSPGGAALPRTDELGAFTSRFSDDAGETWSAARYAVPFRATAIDRRNTWNGSVSIMWSVDQVSVRNGTTFHAFTKIGTYPQDPPEEAFILSSPNLLSERDPAAVEWALLPDGDVGVRPPGPLATSIWEEPHVVPLALSRGFFLVARTNNGFLGASSTADPSAASGWASPGGNASFWAALPAAAGRPLRNPEGPITLRRVPRPGGAVGYLLLYYNRGCAAGGVCYAGRNPYWLAAGVEEGGEVRFSQPEIALFSTDYAGAQAGARPGYPDILFDATRGVLITETNKTDARCHAVDAALVDALFMQATASAPLAGAAVEFDAGAQGKTFPTPPTPLPDASAASRGDGLTLALWVEGHENAAPGEVIIDVGPVRLVTVVPASGAAPGRDSALSRGTWRGSAGALPRAAAPGSAISNGVVPDSTPDSASGVMLFVVDAAGRGGNVSLCARCSSALAGTGTHLVAFVFDASAHVIIPSVDGALCEALEDEHGWAWVDWDMGAAGAAAPSFVLGASYGGRVRAGGWWARAVLNSEVVAAWRAGPQ